MTDTRNDEERVAPAVYLPFRTFIGAFDVFDHGIPRRIDRSMWRSQSGVVQGQIMMALRFFSLIDQNDEPTPALQRFVNGKEKRKEHIAALLQHSYLSIFEHDLTKTTGKMLSEEFDSYRVTGETKRKAIAFFLQAARFAELPMHPLLSSSVRSSAASNQKRKRKANGTAKTPNEPVSVVQPSQENSQTDRKSFRLKSGAEIDIRISANWLELPSDERQFIFDLIDLLQAPSAPLSKDNLEAV